MGYERTTIAGCDHNRRGTCVPDVHNMQAATSKQVKDSFYAGQTGRREINLSIPLPVQGASAKFAVQTSDWLARYNSLSISQRSTCGLQVCKYRSTGKFAGFVLLAPKAMSRAFPVQLDRSALVRTPCSLLLAPTVQSLQICLYSDTCRLPTRIYSAAKY